MCIGSIYAHANSPWIEMDAPHTWYQPHITELVSLLKCCLINKCEPYFLHRKQAVIIYSKCAMYVFIIIYILPPNRACRCNFHCSLMIFDRDIWIILMKETLFAKRMSTSKFKHIPRVWPTTNRFFPLQSLYQLWYTNNLSSVLSLKLYIIIQLWIDGTVLYFIVVVFQQ